MITNAKFRLALKEMMAEMPLEDINVTSLCERCGCHRQTFYYHYQDIYDLIQAILLSETISKFDDCKSIRDALRAFISYAKDNYPFLVQAYNSAAKDLVDDFMFSKFNIKIFLILSEDPEFADIKTEARRALSRRFSNAIVQEIGFCFKSNSRTSEWFQKKMNRFVDNAMVSLFPGYVDLLRKEEIK